MRFLITGSSGQLGTAIAAALAPNHDVIGLDRTPGPQTTHLGSVADGDLIARLLRQGDVVIHAASLHARHLGTATKHDFVETNVTGTLTLLEAAAAARVARVVYTSTTSLYGHALVPTDRAVWVTEDLPPQPRDIYDLTKIAAEHLCRLFHDETRIPAICLRVGRFFPEPPDRLAAYRLYRGLDVRDAAAAHLLAATVDGVGFGTYNIAARTPFVEPDTPTLLRDAPSVIRHYHPTAPAAFARHGWVLPTSIDRVYTIDRAARDLGYTPQHNFADFMQEYDEAQSVGK
jgi:nucleoside-diphosphate-sugar epimerase